MTTFSAEGPDTEVAVILGVDTHLDFHVAVAVDHLGRRLGESSVATTAKGYERLLRGPPASFVATEAGEPLTRKIREHGAALL